MEYKKIENNYNTLFKLVNEVQGTVVLSMLLITSGFKESSYEIENTYYPKKS